MAYVIYTSGTTGKQKAVQIERGSLSNTVQDATKFFEVTESSDCVYQFTKSCFDNSVLEIFVALCNGARLFVQEEEFNVAKFCRHIEAFKITHAFLYPGLVDTFTNEELKSMRQLKYWIVGAEKLSKNLMDRALDLGINVMQNYGPTETTLVVFFVVGFFPSGRQKIIYLNKKIETPFCDLTLHFSAATLCDDECKKATILKILELPSLV